MHSRHSVMENVKKKTKKSSSFLPELVPTRLKIAQKEDGVVMRDLFLVIVILFVILWGLSSISPQKTCTSCGTPLSGWTAQVASFLGVIGLEGDAVGVGVFLYTFIVKLYSEKTYVAGYLDRAKVLYNGYTDDQVKTILRNMHGVLTREATTVLTVEIAGILLGAGTILKLISDIFILGV